MYALREFLLTLGYCCKMFYEKFWLVSSWFLRSQLNYFFVRFCSKSALLIYNFMSGLKFILYIFGNICFTIFTKFVHVCYFWQHVLCRTMPIFTILPHVFIFGNWWLLYLLLIWQRVVCLILHVLCVCLFSIQPHAVSTLCGFSIW